MHDEPNASESARPYRSKEEIMSILKGELVPPSDGATASLPSGESTPNTDGRDAVAPDAVQASVVWTPDQVKEVLRGVFDPELHMNIVDLGLVYGVDVTGDKVQVRMTLTSPGCPYGPYLIHQVRDTAQSLKGITSADVEVVWDPPWGPQMMTEEVRLELGFDI